MAVVWLGAGGAVAGTVADGAGSAPRRPRAPETTLAPPARCAPAPSASNAFLGPRVAVVASALAAASAAAPAAIARLTRSRSRSASAASGAFASASAAAAAAARSVGARARRSP